MPITLYDADGNPQEVPSADEIAAIKQSQAEATAKLTELAEQKTNLEKEKAELETAANPNWKAYREKEKKMKDALKAAGKDVDEDGNIVEKQTAINKDEILSEAKTMLSEQLFSTEKERILAPYSEEEKKTLSIYLDKLMAGEDKSIGNLHKYLDQAVSFVFPGKTNDVKRAMYSDNGAGPNINNNNKVSEEAVEMGSQLGNSKEDLETKSDPVIIF